MVNLVQSKHKKDFDSWTEKLYKIGYKTIWGIINSHDYGLLQARRRVFALSIYDPDNKLDLTIERTLDEKLKEIFNNKEYKPVWIQKHQNIFDFENEHFDESELSQMKETPSRVKMQNKGLKITKEYKGKIPTITTKQDRWPNAGNIEFENKREDKNGVPYLNYRFITPRESFKLMGFSESHYNRALKEMNKKCVSKISAREKLNKQAGNSIAVNCLEMIFYLVAKLEEMNK